MTLEPFKEFLNIDDDEAVTIMRHLDSDLDYLDELKAAKGSYQREARRRGYDLREVESEIQKREIFKEYKNRIDHCVKFLVANSSKETSPLLKRLRSISENWRNVEALQELNNFNPIIKRAETYCEKSSLESVDDFVRQTVRKEQRQRKEPLKIPLDSLEYPENTSLAQTFCYLGNGLFVDPFEEIFDLEDKNLFDDEFSHPSLEDEMSTRISRDVNFETVEERKIRLANRGKKFAGVKYK